MRNRITRRGLLAGITACCAAGNAAAAIDFDLALVLGIDVSYSVNTEEFQIQMQGTAQALRAPEVLEAISRGTKKRIALSVFLWSDPKSQHVLVPWHSFANARDAANISSFLSRVPRSISPGTTATGQALLFGQSLLDGAPSAFREVIDLSTDGECNEGPKVKAVRDALVAQGTVINGLAITKDVTDLDHYLKQEVIGGNGAFVITANTYDAYGQALRQKLFREITNVDLI